MKIRKSRYHGGKRYTLDRFLHTHGMTSRARSFIHRNIISQVGTLAVFISSVLAHDLPISTCKNDSIPDFFTPYDVILQKRDGKELSKNQILRFVSEFHEGKIPDYQMTALLMAIAIRGMTIEETNHLTAAYVSTGIIANLTGMSGPTVDKHSTGGVGDKVCLFRETCLTHMHQTRTFALASCVFRQCLLSRCIYRSRAREMNAKCDIHRRIQR